MLLPVLGHYSYRPDSARLFLCLSACFSLCFPKASPLSRNTCCPPRVSSSGSQSFVRTRCQLTKCEGHPSLRELRGAFPSSWQLKLFYCICSWWLQATLLGPVPIAFRHLLLCLIKESAGVCCHASSLYMHTAASLCLLCFMAFQSTFRCSSPLLFQYAFRWQFLCPIRKRILVVRSQFTKNTISAQLSSQWASECHIFYCLLHKLWLSTLVAAQMATRQMSPSLLHYTQSLWQT